MEQRLGDDCTYKWVMMVDGFTKDTVTARPPSSAKTLNINGRFYLVGFLFIEFFNLNDNEICIFPVTKSRQSEFSDISLNV